MEIYSQLHLLQWPRTPGNGKKDGVSGRESVHPSRTWLLLGEALISLKAFISLDLSIPHSLKQPVHPPELGRIFVHLILILVNSYFIKMTPSRRRALTVK